ncbi:polysaccharide biosynthesis/export family protein [Hymenobacter glaciei]|uniref:polysaccharide biosynthesis/export family protein n=1 Tax=Hymenobacter glaciei TaxID=877209 RepID=UPI0031E81A36
MARNLLFGLVLCLLTGCTQNLFQSTDKTKYQAFAPDPAYEYKLRKDDKLSISVWDHEELSVGSIYSVYSSGEEQGKWVLVGPDGKIGFSKVGSFPVEGLTVAAAQANLQRALGKWIVNPQVTIKVLNKEVTVLGEVNTPGVLLLQKERNTLLEVLGRAGDLTVYAEKRHVKVARPEGTALREMEIDLTQLDRNYATNIVVLPGDVVYVPARKGKQFDKKAGTSLAVTSAITAILLFTRIITGL